MKSKNKKKWNKLFKKYGESIPKHKTGSGTSLPVTLKSLKRVMKEMEW